MSDVSFRFQLGAFDCWIISDGTIKIPGDHQMELTCLFIKTGKNNVLIDSGEGKGISPASGYLLENMKTAGIDPAAVDRVIITHSHMDHIGGLVDAKGNPYYPNARYAMHKKEWDYRIPTLHVKSGGEGKNEDTHIATGRRNLIPILDQFDVFDDESEIIPGIKYVLMPGHTPGNTMIVISSGKDQILCLGDIIHEPAEFTHPDMWAQWDMNAEEAIRSRVQILSRAASTHALVFFCHFPFPGVGYILKKDDKFIWEPVAKE